MQVFAPSLNLAILAARAAGDLLRSDFHRPGGPRGGGDKAPADTEAEVRIREILLDGSDWGFLGEETGRVRSAAGAPVWVVDPNDGTRDYVRGRRGSSVSIALVFEGRPVLGVVHPFNWPDDGGSVYAAVEGREGLFKNGAPVAPMYPDRLDSIHVVLVSGGGDRAARANLRCTDPARVMAIPSIAHRLAKVAAGEAAATTSLYSPKSWDFAAGHALLKATGGVLLDAHGREPAYDAEGFGSAPRLFASSRSVAEALRSRPWDEAFHAERDAALPVVRLARGRACPDPARLSRAHGAFLGQLAGSALAMAYRTEGVKDAPTLASFVREARNHRVVAGQLATMGELAVAAARVGLDHGPDLQAARDAYSAWARSSPPDDDRAMSAAAIASPVQGSTSPSALARVVSLALRGVETTPEALARNIDADTALTHSGTLVREVAQLLGICVRALILEGDAVRALEQTHAFARRSLFSREAIEVAGRAMDPRSAVRPFEDDAIDCVRAAFRAAASGDDLESAIMSTRSAGRPRDGILAIVAAVIGARDGRECLPTWLRDAVLTCRPIEGMVQFPRPPIYWATDALAIAESLMSCSSTDAGDRRR